VLLGTLAAAPLLTALHLGTNVLEILLAFQLADGARRRSGAGTYQTLVAMTRDERPQPVICTPEPAPTRNETVARFLEWAKRHPQYLSDPAVETVGRFFVTEFPCRPK